MKRGVFKFGTRDMSLKYAICVFFIICCSLNGVVIVAVIVIIVVFNIFSLFLKR